MNKLCPICKASYGGGEVFCPVDAARLISPSQFDRASQSGPDQADPLIGTRLDKYDVVRRIGEGGMGLVYEAVHSFIEKRVAIKVLREDFSRRPEVVERFRQEAKSASRIGHENIVDIVDFGETPSGASYFVMEFLEGEDLANVLARETTLSQGRTIKIIAQCCRALGAAHSKGIVHRDMKPENIFLTKREGGEDFVKIVDFGIAKMSDIETEGAPGRKLTKTGMIFGTPEYMSPEQAAGKGLDHRVDIYALGVLLYECLTGRVPFFGDTFMGVLTQHMFEDPPPLREVNPHVECSAELEMVIAKAMAKSADDRYATMDELAEALEEASHGRVSQATQMGYGEPVRAPAQTAPTLRAGEFGPPKAKSNALPLIAAAVVLVGAGIGAAVALLGGDDGAAAEVADAGTTLVAAEPPEDAGVEVEEPAAEVVPEAPEPVLAAVVPVRVTAVGHPGSQVTVEGHEELSCEATPCTLELPRGLSFTINARHNRFRGHAEITPESAMDIQIAMRARRIRGPMNSGMTQSTMMNGVHGDLKMPELFQ